MKGLVKDLMNNELPVAGGFIAGHYVTEKLAPKVPYIGDNEKMHPLIPIAAGIVVKKFLGKNAMLKSMGTGLIAYGAANFVGKMVPALSINGMSEEEINDVINDVINDTQLDTARQYAEFANTEMNGYEESEEALNGRYDDDDDE